VHVIVMRGLLPLRRLLSKTLKRRKKSGRFLRNFRQMVEDGARTARVELRPKRTRNAEIQIEEI